MDFFRAAAVSPIFKGLDPRELELIAAQSHVRTFEKGELLFYEDEEPSHWFYVVDGLLRAYKTSQDGHEVSICHLNSGMAVNDIRFHDNRYKAITFGTVEAQSKGVLIGIKVASLPLLFTQIPEFTIRCFNTVLNSIENYQCAFYSGMVLDAMGKVAFMLAHDLERFNRLKKQEVAALLNIQPETLSRLLGKLIRKGIIASEGSVIILDSEALKTLYN